MAGHSPDIGLPFDPTTARRLLANAGYPGGKGLPLLEVIWADSPANRDQGNYLAKQWQEWLGITAEPVYLPAYEWAQSLFPDLPPMIHFLSWGADFPDPDNFLRRGVGTALRLNKKLEAITETAARTTDQQKRLALYRQADKMLMEEALIIPLTYGLDHYFIGPRVRSFPTASRFTLRWRDIVVDPD
jgi:oligopeptide transport system substrate-binding protein